MIHMFESCNMFVFNEPIYLPLEYWRIGFIELKKLTLTLVIYKLFDTNIIKTAINLVIFEIHSVTHHDVSSIDFFYDLKFVAYFAFGYLTLYFLNVEDENNEKLGFREKIENLLLAFYMNFKFTVLGLTSIIFLSIFFRYFIITLAGINLDITHLFSYLYVIFISWIPYIYILGLYIQW